MFCYCFCLLVGAWNWIKISGHLVPPRPFCFSLFFPSILDHGFPFCPLPGTQLIVLLFYYLLLCYEIWMHINTKNMDMHSSWNLFSFLLLLFGCVGILNHFLHDIAIIQKIIWTIEFFVFIVHMIFQVICSLAFFRCNMHLLKIKDSWVELFLVTQRKNSTSYFSFFMYNCSLCLLFFFFSMSKNSFFLCRCMWHLKKDREFTAGIIVWTSQTRKSSIVQIIFCFKYFTVKILWNQRRIVIYLKKKFFLFE